MSQPTPVSQHHVWTTVFHCRAVTDQRGNLQPSPGLLPGPLTLLKLPFEVRSKILKIVVDSVEVIRLADLKIFPSTNKTITDTSLLPYMGASCTSKQLHIEVEKILREKGKFISITGTHNECWKFMMHRINLGPSVGKIDWEQTIIDDYSEVSIPREEYFAEWIETQRGIWRRWKLLLAEEPDVHVEVIDRPSTVLLPTTDPTVDTDFIRVVVEVRFR